MRSDCIPVVAHGDQPMQPGHMSLGQFYIGSGDVNQQTLLPQYRTSSNVELNGDSSQTPKDLGDPERKKESPQVASVQLDHSKALECADEIKVVDSEYLNKPSNELHEPLGSTTISTSNGLALQPATTNVPAGFPCIDRQVAFQPVSRVCESVEDTWRDPVPNGGWGWLVVFGSFLCMFVVDGVCFSYGMYMHEMIVEGQFPGDQPGVHQSRPSLAALTLPGALLCGTYLLIGPFAGALVNRFDYRCVAMVGALLVTISFTVSALWIYDLRWFTVVFGLAGGIGFGLIYLPAITVVGHWFEQRRAFVVGVAMCGGGLGSGVVAALVRPLARHVAWRGTLILTAALFCQTLLGIALFRPLYVHELIKIAQRHKRRRQEAQRLTEASKKREKKKRFSGRPKNSGERKAYFQRGSIMARIIEEKSRQRTTSTGSLDGMVITRENELAPLSDPDAYEALMAAAAAYVSQCQASGHGTTATAVPNTGTTAVVTESSSSTTMSSTTPTLVYERSTISTAIPSGRGPGNLQTVKEGVAFPAQNAAPVAVLPPPVQFSRTAVRRIACAILRKLYAANLLPSYLSAGTTNASRHRSGQFYSPLIGGGSRTDSWTTFDAITSSRQPMSEHTSGVYDAIDPDVTSLRERVSERKASLGVGVGLKKLSLRHESLPQSDLTEVSKVVARERPTSRTVTSSRLSAQNEISRSPSQLASMVSLDSRTDQLIAQELRLLPLDAQTKDAVLAALRAELSRPKYRADFFHCSSRKPSGAEPEVELRTSLTEPGTQFRMPPESHLSSWKRGSALPTYEVFPTASPSSPVPVRASNNQISPLRLIDPSRVSREFSIPNTVTAVPGAMRVSSVLEDPGPRLWDWLSDPVELNDPGDEILAYLREMLDWRLLFSVTFLVLLVACSLNMLVLLVPFHFLPLLLEFGGMECRTNTLWCPEGLPNKSDQSWMTAILTWPSDGTAFVSPGAILLTIGVSSIVGRLLAAMYIEKGVGTGCRAFQRCPCVGDPLLLNNVLLVLCAFSLACFPLSVHGVIVTPSRSDRDDFDQFGEDGSKQVQAWTIQFRLMLFFVASVIYGLASAISLSLRSVILVELFGIRRLTNAFGYLLIFQGLAVILGPPLFGYFCDGECHGYLDYCGLPGSVPTRHSFFHNTACAKRLVYAFYICAALFLLTSLLFMPLRWLARYDAECTARCMRTVRRTAAPPPVFPSSSMGHDPTLVPPEIFPMGSVYSAPNVQYDPQQTQTTQILPEVE